MNQTITQNKRSMGTDGHLYMGDSTLASCQKGYKKVLKTHPPQGL